MPKRKNKRNINDLFSKTRKKLGRNLTFDEAMDVWNKYHESEYEANRQAEVLSAKDFAVTINTRA